MDSMETSAELGSMGFSGLHRVFDTDELSPGTVNDPKYNEGLTTARAQYDKKTKTYNFTKLPAGSLRERSTRRKTAITEKEKQARAVEQAKQDYSSPQKRKIMKSKSLGNLHPELGTKVVGEKTATVVSSRERQEERDKTGNP